MGQGTAIKVLFPSSEQAVPAFERSPGGLAAWRGAGIILVVDDEEGVRLVASKTLEAAGFSVIVAKDGRAAVQVFRAHANEIKAVLLDMTMPHMSGEEVFREMRSIQPGVRVILSSGYNEQETISLFRGKGLAGFIQKPYQPVKLIEMVRQILAQNDAVRSTEAGV